MLKNTVTSVHKVFIFYIMWLFLHTSGFMAMSPVPKQQIVSIIFIYLNQLVELYFNKIFIFS